MGEFSVLFFIDSLCSLHFVLLQNFFVFDFSIL